MRPRRFSRQLRGAMSSQDEDPSPALSAVLSSAWSAALSAAVAVAMAVDAKADLARLLDEWEETRQGTTEQLVSILTRISELIEQETEEYYKSDPDPFDDRHPGRADPNCMLGQLLRMLFLNDDFTNSLLDTYIMSSRDISLNTAACRLLQNIVPGLDTAVVFEEKEGLVGKLFTWAREAQRPLCIYATGLLAKAMSNQEVATSHKEENAQLVPMMIKRLHELQSVEHTSCFSPTHTAQNLPQDSQDEAPHMSGVTKHQQIQTGFSEEGTEEKNVAESSSSISNGKSSAQRDSGGSSSSARLLPGFVYQASPHPTSKEKDDTQGGEEGGGGTKQVENGRKAKQKLNFTTSASGTEDEAEVAATSEQPSSSSSWSEMSSILIGSEYRLLPLSPTMEQRLILQYLTPLGDYQELLAIFMKMDTRSLMMNYIDLRKTKNVQLTFDALLYLASLLLHKKFATEFIAHGGVQKLLEIPRPSMAATAVSLCLYYLAYNQDAMERVCMFPGDVLTDLVSYALWLLESSHASGICHATMFFSISFSFRVVLQLFDQLDGLRRLVNLISTLEILNTDNDAPLMNEDQVFSNRQTAKHTCMALRRYFEAHLAVKTEQMKQSLHTSESGTIIPQQPPYKAYANTREQIIEMMEFLIECGPPEGPWEPVQVFCKLSCIPLMLQLISAACDWKTYYGRSDIVRFALDILAILTVVPKVQLVLADTVEVIDENRSPVPTVGMSIILGVAEGEVFPNDAEIQKSALQVIINCVCAPDQSLSAFAVAPLRQPLHPQQPPPSHNRVLAHMWQVVQNNNGIKVLLSLLSVKVPITDADLIRALACKALVGLSRSAAIRQIISKLPLFASGHIQQNTDFINVSLKQTPAMKKQLERHMPSPPTLDSIITEYLREQHARCSNPVTTCPPFSLFNPHRCPESKQRRQASPNFTARLGSRMLYPKYRGVDRGSLDRQLIFSRFRPVSVFRENNGGDSSFTCCAFSARERFLMLGTCSGHLKLYNIFSGEEAADYTCHGSAISYIEPSRDGNFVLTSASWSVPLSALWSMDSIFTMKNSFGEDHYVEFSKLCQDRVIGTKDQVAHIYDIQTGQEVLTLNDPALANNYKRNCATFNPTDDLVLNDGVLWDVRASRAIHKFDKFNMNLSGVFHPNGLEVIINTEIWDLRSFHLLHTVPALDQCRVVFNSNGTIMYGAMLQADDEHDVMDQQVTSPFGSSFRTFDATDYKPIATLDVKRNIFDLCTDTKDHYLAVIENQDAVTIDTVCRLYEVGRQKLAEEGDDDDQDEDQNNDSSDTDDDEDDDDDDDMDIEPLIEELANEEEQEDQDQADLPADDAIEALLGSTSGDDGDDDTDHDSEALDHALSWFGEESDDDDPDMFGSLPDLWF
ncbi:protein VPRBP-like [Poecilia formosa]|uniref:protein VPRBP-like n=1 Tax=Poecilia formosa TaxID=48698 RepID=UPI0007B85815|nr:PREDICTED: protein VPRBP-like [Poecilia formosa]